MKTVMMFATCFEMVWQKIYISVYMGREKDMSARKLLSRQIYVFNVHFFKLFHEFENLKNLKKELDMNSLL